ncbi:MAG: ABC transporter ATP-binding protein [Acidobacteriota bacterium]|nr:ABC transporter ATP-binding protein [Acidobacteriota bacterium]
MSVARLSLGGVTHRFGSIAAVRDIDLYVDSGEVVCLLGPSGSGKSTLLRLIAGLERLRVGRIEVDGSEVASPKHHEAPERRSVGFMFQDYALFPHLDARANVAFGLPREPSSDGLVEELIERVGMTGFASAMPHTLSGGQQQRIALARALAPEPRVMLLDEPFSGLEPRLREDVRSTTLALLRDRGVATLMVTHDPVEALGAADRVGVMREGRLVQIDTPAEVYNRSANREIAEGFGPINVLVGVVQGGFALTAVGKVKAGEVKEGAGVSVLVRPEAIEISDVVGVAGRVTASIQEGGTSRLTVILDDGTQIEVRELSIHRRRMGDSVFLRLAEGCGSLLDA